jgi:DNA repair protein RecO (recombination protein O)
MDYGDFDIIVTFFTLQKGKLSLIAKSAKKSTKRFAGILELFSVLEIVGSANRGKGLPVLQEAVLKQPFGGIRADFKKTAYASYWSELIYNWIEENYKQTALYYLFDHVLTELDSGSIPEDMLNILFLMRFLSFSGHVPNLDDCSRCRTKLENFKQDIVEINLSRGGILCENCSTGSKTVRSLAKGTIKQLLWIERGNFARASRIKFAQPTLRESTEFLEDFISYHLGKRPRSLKFLRQIRG